MSYVITALYLLITQYGCCTDVITRTIPEKAQREAGFDAQDRLGIVDYSDSDHSHSSDSDTEAGVSAGNAPVGAAAINIVFESDGDDLSDNSSEDEGLMAAAVSEFEMYYNLPEGHGNIASVSLSSAGVNGFGAAAKV